MTGSKEPVSQRKRDEAYKLNNFRVLIADDFPFMAELMSSMMREFGVGHVLLANDGQEAKEMLVMFNSDPGSQMHIDLVILDWLMPNMDGIETLKWIRGARWDNIKFLPVIMCSGYASEDVIFESRDNGANEALVKPISAEKLANRILHIIDKPRPFIKAPNFFGPDRRRKVEEFSGDEKRVTKAEEVKTHHEKL